ncbi:hypothetical protein A9Q74_00200 [Colwellia sp. 39_35_sub15_T18]|nr:hypothetical protein A9Q74_00200 [Colwellia sp. 39_35_sub15_T18]
MTALIIVDLTPINKDKLAAYSAEAAKTLVTYQGEFLSKGPIVSLHGKSAFTTKVIIQFPSSEKALNWYNSEEYQAIIPIRDAGMESQFHLIAQ